MDCTLEKLESLCSQYKDMRLGMRVARYAFLGEVSEFSSEVKKSDKSLQKLIDHPFWDKHELPRDKCDIICVILIYSTNASSETARDRARKYAAVLNDLHREGKKSKGSVIQALEEVGIEKRYKRYCESKKKHSAHSESTSPSENGAKTRAKGNSDMEHSEYSACSEKFNPSTCLSVNFTKDDIALILKSKKVRLMVYIEPMEEAWHNVRGRILGIIS